MNLTQAALGKQYIVVGIETGDEALTDFLFTLGCYIGEPITVVSKIGGGYVISVKNARYHIDHNLARAILI